MFLTADELRELTGLKRPSAQARWLRKNGIAHYRRADGGVVVTKHAVEQPAAPARPNWRALAINR